MYIWIETIVFHLENFEIVDVLKILMFTLFKIISSCQPLFRSQLESIVDIVWIGRRHCQIDLIFCWTFFFRTILIDASNTCILPQDKLTINVHWRCFGYIFQVKNSSFYLMFIYFLVIWGWCNIITSLIVYCRYLLPYVFISSLLYTLNDSFNS